MKQKCTSLVSISDKTAEMVLLIADLKDLKAKFTALIADEDTEQQTMQLNKAHNTVFNALLAFYEEHLCNSIKRRIERGEIEI